MRFSAAAAAAVAAAVAVVYGMVGAAVVVLTVAAVVAVVVAVADCSLSVLWTGKQVSHEVAQTCRGARYVAHNAVDLPLFET